ncbi:uncharacterized protein [Triticum aestivum]|uniref:uncharacterized protein isoform X1 n=1 Tax=Triticum aestivum TaxID=4565 RepID=UPI001D018D2B|nr:uncharacterized protein LOC123151400 isoform X1 [Triticum aestivum]
MITSTPTPPPDVTTSTEPDTRRLLNGSCLTTRGAYAALASQLTDPSLSQIWDSKVPKKVMIFGWLFYLDRLNTRANLLKKHILQTAVCPRCNNHVEDRDHLFFTCPAARRIWRALGLKPRFNPTADLFVTAIPAVLPSSVRSFMLLLFLWKIWDARNKKVFQNLEIDVKTTVKAILEDLILWTHRLKTAALKEHAGLWRDFLSSRIL